MSEHLDMAKSVHLQELSFKTNVMHESKYIAP